MIISSLIKYHELMAERGEVLPDGYSSIEINYLISLTPSGQIDGIISLGEVDGKHKVYPKALVPERTQKPGIDSNILEHRPLYIFGIANDKGVLTSTDNKAVKSHKDFVDKNLQFFENINSPIAKAYVEFIKHWQPEKNCDNPYLVGIIKDYDKSRYAFCLSGQPETTLHNDQLVKEHWQKYYSNRQSNTTNQVATCSILGEQLPIAEIHNTIKGIKGGQASGCKLVCVNNTAENSYGKEQGNNCCISQVAMKQYTEALNYLLMDNLHKTYLGDMTVVHFALHEDDTELVQFVSSNIFDSQEQLTQEDKDKGIKENIESISRGNKPDFDNEYWDKAQYCMFGLVPNSSRVAIKFSWQNSFGYLRRNIEQYHKDFAINQMDKAPSLWRIKKELISSKSSAELPPDYMQGYMNSVLNGTPFPSKILHMVISRIKTDQNDDKNKFAKFNDTRMGILKACLNRNKRIKEEITMSLNNDNKTPAYLCGRLLAILEKIQLNASGGKLNKTIVDTYFSSACSTPALVLPRLIKLSQAHQVKLTEGMQVYFGKLIGEVLQDLNQFPKTLPLEEQGNFILGYYQQRQDFYTTNKTEEN